MGHSATLEGNGLLPPSCPSSRVDESFLFRGSCLALPTKGALCPRSPARGDATFGLRATTHLQNTAAPFPSHPPKNRPPTRENKGSGGNNPSPKGESLTSPTLPPLVGRLGDRPAPKLPPVGLLRLLLLSSCGRATSRAPPGRPQQERPERSRTRTPRRRLRPSRGFLAARTPGPEGLAGVVVQGIGDARGMPVAAAKPRTRRHRRKERTGRAGQGMEGWQVEGTRVEPVRPQHGIELVQESWRNGGSRGSGGGQRPGAGGRSTRHGRRRRTASSLSRRSATGMRPGPSLSFPLRPFPSIPHLR